MDAINSYAKLRDSSFDELASSIWRAVVSETLPPIKHYQHYLTSQPAKDVGGDFQLATDNWLAVGDVSGKGVPAALLTGMFVAAFKLAVRSHNPAKALEHALFTELESANMFTTLAAVELGGDGWLNYFNLGHPPVLIRRQDGKVESLNASAPPVGTFRLDSYPTESIRLRAGDSICMYTDGLLEAENPNNVKELFGLERLKSVFSLYDDAGVAHEAIMDELTKWHLTDDLTLVVLQYRPEVGWTDSRLDRR